MDFFGAAFRIPPRLRQKRIADVMETTGSTYMQDRYVETLSHGMKQRVGIARTLLHDPQVLIFDEPANGLDPQARIEMRALLLRLASLGKTLIVTSHILPELSRICDQVAIINNGKLCAFGTLDEITRQVGQQRSIEIQLNNVEDIPRTLKIARQSTELDEDVSASEAEGIVRMRTRRRDAELGEVLVPPGSAISWIRAATFTPSP